MDKRALADARLATASENIRPLADTVLRLIWHARRISRAEIARQANLARSTVSEIVGGLLERGLVQEAGPGKSRGGRRPIVLEFRDDACAILGIEMGAKHVAVALTDLRGHVREWAEERHDVRNDPAGARALIERLCDHVVATDRSPAPLVGIGLAVPSPFDPAEPHHLSEVVMPEWKGTLGLGHLAEHFGVPLFADNDANLGALAEHWWGACTDIDNFAYVKVATGVGSGHVIGGEIYRGARGVAGEIGHLAIDPTGDPCICGLKGCLTTLVGTPALLSRIAALLPEHPESVLGEETPVTLAAFEKAAGAGDALALRVVGEMAEHLGIALAGMINLMNPTRVVIDGDLARLRELLLVPLRETVQQRTRISAVEPSQLCTSSLGPRSVAVGAATLVLKHALEDSRLFPVVDVPEAAKS